MPSSNNSLVASGAADACLKIHDINTMKTVQSFQCHSKRIKRLAVSGNSPSIVWTASEDGTVR